MNIINKLIIIFKNNYLLFFIKKIIRKRKGEKNNKKNQILYTREIIFTFVDKKNNLFKRLNSKSILSLIFNISHSRKSFL